MSYLFVCLMGMGTVFVGLICIVFICMITSYLVRMFQKDEVKPKEQVIPSNNSASAPIANKQEIVAAVSAVIAHETGAEAKNIRILSFKKIG